MPRRYRVAVIDSDFGRLKTAFGAARERGYGANLASGWQICCSGCAHAEAERGPKGYMVTHEQAYGPAFWGHDGAQPFPALIEAEIAADRAQLGEDYDDDEITGFAARDDLDESEQEDLDFA